MSCDVRYRNVVCLTVVGFRCVMYLSQKPADRLFFSLNLDRCNRLFEAHIRQKTVKSLFNICFQVIKVFCAVRRHTLMKMFHWVCYSHFVPINCMYVCMIVHRSDKSGGVFSLKPLLNNELSTSIV